MYRILKICRKYVYDISMSRQKNTEKRSRFVRLAVKRVNRTINDMRLIGNLANRSVYSFTEDDVRKILRALQKELDTVKAKFGGPGSSSENDFTLD